MTLQAQVLVSVSYYFIESGAFSIRVREEMMKDIPGDNGQVVSLSQWELQQVREGERRRAWLSGEALCHYCQGQGGSN